MTGKKAIQERNAKHLATVTRANALKAREQEEREAAFAAREMRRARIRARLHDDCAEQRETVAAARANAGDAHAADRMRNAATCHRARSLGEEQRALDVEIEQAAKETGQAIAGIDTSKTVGDALSNILTAAAKEGIKGALLQGLMSKIGPAVASQIYKKLAGSLLSKVEEKVAMKVIEEVLDGTGKAILGTAFEATLKAANGKLTWSQLGDEIVNELMNNGLEKLIEAKVGN